MSDESPSQVRPGQRIAKAMARAGLCSRRDAEAWIAAGRVTVNGEALTSPAYNVSEADDVRVDGEPLAPIERTRLFFFHKPRGLVTTARDPEGRPTIFDALPPGLPRLIAVGRLDINTEGLLLLTNDGGLARVLELPSTGWLRRYRVRAHGTIDQARLDGLSEGVTLDGVHYAGIEARLDREQGSNVWLTMGLREGKNREIKKVLDHLGLAVNRLIRVSFGPFELGDLADGEVAEVRTRVLRDQLGVKLAREADANFDAPIGEPPSTERAADASPRRLPERQRRPERQKETRARSTSRDPRKDPTARSPRREPPSAPARKRKHVSTLRAEIAAAARGPRKRIERGATHDRKGRSVTVERMTPARVEAAGGSGGDRGAGASRGPKHARGPGARTSRNRGGEGGAWPADGAKTGFGKRSNAARGAGGPRFDRSGAARRTPGEDGARERNFRGGDDRKPRPAGK